MGQDRRPNCDLLFCIAAASQVRRRTLTAKSVHMIEGNEDATEELESVIADEPDQLLRDCRDSAAALGRCGWCPMAGQTDS